MGNAKNRSTIENYIRVTLQIKKAKNVSTIDNQIRAMLQIKSENTKNHDNPVCEISQHLFAK
jgi:hypothetical protein